MSNCANLPPRPPNAPPIAPATIAPQTPLVTLSHVSGPFPIASIRLLPTCITAPDNAPTMAPPTTAPTQAPMVPASATLAPRAPAADAANPPTAAIIAGPTTTITITITIMTSNIFSTVFHHG